MWTAGDTGTSRSAATAEWLPGTGVDNALEALLVALNGDPVALDIPLGVITGGFVVKGRLVTDDEFARHVDHVLEELIRGADYFVSGAVVDERQIENLREELLALFKRGPFQQGGLRRKLARRRLAQRGARGDGSTGNGSTGDGSAGNGSTGNGSTGDDANPRTGECTGDSSSRNGDTGATGVTNGSGNRRDELGDLIQVDLGAFADPGREPTSTEVLTLKNAEILVAGQGWTEVGLIRVLVSQVSAWWLSGYSDSPLDL